MTFATRARRIFNRDNLPKSRVARILIGVLLVLGGVVGFLPILGFWMIPLGLTILAIDIPFLRPWVCKLKTWIIGLWKKFFKVKR